MTRKTSMKFLFMGIPLVALAALVLVLTFGTGSGGAGKASAANPNSVNVFRLSIPGNCTSGPVATKCNVTAGAQFKVDVSIVSYAGPDYIDFNPQVAVAGGVTIKTATQAPGGDNCNAWTTPHFDLSGPIGITGAEVSCALNPATSPPNSTQKGKIGELTFTCGQTNGTLTGIAPGSTLNDTPATFDGPLTVNCRQPTATSTASPTATPPPVPRMKKCGPDSTGTPIWANGCKNLENMFLVHRNPAPRCQDSLDSVTLSEGLSQAIVTQNVKDENQSLAAFEFEIRYDTKLVCIGIAVNPAQTTADPDLACSIQDDGVNMPFPGAHGAEAGKGLARVGCVTVGKTAGHILNAAAALAFIKITPTAEAVSSLRPNQDNGIPVQIQNQNCKLADRQGHTIPIFSCEDADITIRFLEGDVVPNCDVNVADTQDIAFRWGASLGSTLYQSFKDLVPSGQVKGDGKINISDLQFVYGRFGSNCAVGEQWPPQPPIKAKA